MGILRKLVRLSIPAAGLAALAVAGCATTTRVNRIKHSRELRLTSPFDGEGTLTAQTHNGSIAITGEATDECVLVATIETEAASESEAAEISEGVTVALEGSGDDIDVRIEQPELDRNQVVRVHLNTTVPSGASARFGSHNGSIDVSGVVSAIGGTHNGPITIRSVDGPVDVHSHNGAIRCEDISGPSKMRTHNGQVVARLTAVDPIECVARTHNGSIDLEAPDSFAGRVSLRSHNGAIHSDFPVTVSGKISRGRLEGTVPPETAFSMSRLTTGPYIFTQPFVNKPRSLR